MEQKGMPFDRRDLDKVNASMLVTVIANQHAMFDIITSHLDIPQEQLFKEFNDLLPLKIQAVLDQLYKQHGMTPDVLG